MEGIDFNKRTFEEIRDYVGEFSYIDTQTGEVVRAFATLYEELDSFIKEVFADDTNG